MAPSPVWALMLARMSPGSLSVIEPSPVLTDHAEPIVEPGFAAASIDPSPVWRSTMSKRPSTRTLPSPVEAVRRPSAPVTSIEPSPVLSLRSPFVPLRVMPPSPV